MRQAWPKWDLFVVSAAGLYLELAIIRLLSSEIRVFAYFKNFPLLAAFIGLGLGCYVAGRRPIRLWVSTVLVLLLSMSAVFSKSLHLSHLFFPDPSLFIFRGSILSPSLLDRAKSYSLVGGFLGDLDSTILLMVVGLTSFSAIAVLFMATAWVFYPIGQMTGALLGPLSPLPAYSINVAGALAGSLAFTLVSYWQLGPTAWIVPPLLAVAYLARTGGRKRSAMLAVVGAAILGFTLPQVGGTGEKLVWSPYYRISLVPGLTAVEGAPNRPELGWTLRVNHDYFQRAVDLRPAVRSQAPELQQMGREYDLPYRLLGHVERVLVVGAGMGNDVAAALRAGARRVDAVEIDPAIVRLGRDLHPERPLADTRTVVTVDDARAFFRRSAKATAKGSYDLVVFGLLDSHTALSSMSSVRLEFYVYTVESLREALSLLDPEHGLAVVGFSVGWSDWVGARLRRTIADAAGQTPMVLVTSNYDGNVTYLAGPGLSRIDAARLNALGVQEVSGKYETPARPVTDDWPFLYVNPDHWPWVYIAALATLLIVGSLLVRRLMKQIRMPTGDHGSSAGFDVHMFLMGAAFMLVETGAIARLSLLFGATWVVNAAVICAVLLMVLGANALVANRRAPSLWACYGLLCTSLAAVYVVPFEWFFDAPAGPVLASLVVAMPVLFAGLVFARTFEHAVNSHVALGCNMLGAIAGGVLEAVSLAAGIKALSLLALAVYMLSAVTLRRGNALAFDSSAAPSAT